MWRKTSKQVIDEIFKQHKDELIVFASLTDMTGYGYEWSNGQPEAITEWGFENAKNPLYMVAMTKETEQDETWKYEYFLYYT